MRVPSPRRRTEGGRPAKPYHPSERKPYMNPRQLEYFRARLLAWKAELAQQMEEARQRLRADRDPFPEELDRAREDLDRSLEIRTRERQRKLMVKIDAALQRIEDGTYGYCEETGEPIGLKRLLARPIATLCLEAQRLHEKQEKLHGR